MWYNVQQQEEWDYQPQSELQNAYALSQQEFQDDRQQINDLRRAGRFVVAVVGPAYCPRTDACMGERLVYLADFGTQHQADKHRETLGEEDGDGEYRTEVFPPLLPPAPYEPLTDADIPF